MMHPRISHGDHTKKSMTMNSYDKVAILIMVIFFILNLLALMNFPTVHSDELWLKGIADEMVSQTSFAVTEPFFDLYPRVIHPFRWLYNGALIVSLKIFGDSVASVRLVSLFFGTSALGVVYQISKRQFSTSYFGVAAMLLLTLDIQMIYSTHMGRQETFILFLLLFGYLLILKKDTKRLSLKLALIVLLGMGVHPNSFILGVVFSTLLFFRWCVHDDKLSTLINFILTTFLGAGFYLVGGFLMNPNFIRGYFKYGSSLGVDAPLTNRFEGFYWYWYKLFHQIGGTYDLFDIRLQLTLLGFLMILWSPLLAISLLRKSAFKPSSQYYPLLSLIGITFSLLIIGRYNQTAVVFLMPFIVLLALSTFDKIHALKKIPILLPALILLMITLWGVNLSQNISSYETQRFYDKKYETMLEEISESVPADAVVLGNLNLIEAFDPHRFFDVRNLGYLDDAPDAFSAYIKTHKIEYIILHDEMAYIDRTKPKWDFLYVNIDYYPHLQQFLTNHTIRVKAIENPIYAMRISRFSGTFPWETVIYKVVQ